MGVLTDYLNSDKRRSSIESFIINASKNSNEISIEQICSSLQLDYTKTVKDIEAMVKLSYQYRILNKAYIDLSKKVLVISEKGDGSILGNLKNIVDDASGALLGQKFFGQKNSETKIAVTPTKCKNCGAPVNGQMAECEYCGTPLNKGV